MKRPRKTIEWEWVNASNVRAADIIMNREHLLEVESTIDGFRKIVKIVIKGDGPKSKRTMTMQRDATVKVLAGYWDNSILDEEFGNPPHTKETDDECK